MTIHEHTLGETEDNICRKCQKNPAAGFNPRWCLVCKAAYMRKYRKAGRDTYLATRTNSANARRMAKIPNDVPNPALEELL